MINKYLTKYSNRCTVFYACNLVDNLLILGATDSSSLNSLRNCKRYIENINFEFKENLKINKNKVQNNTKS